MKILHLIIKNTSSIDFMLPVFWKIKKTDPSSEILVLYCVLNKFSIVAKDTYYDNTLNSLGVRQVDIIDLIGSHSLYKSLAILDEKLSCLSKGVSRDDLLNSDKWITKIDKIFFYTVSVMFKKMLRKIFSFVINGNSLSSYFKYDIALIDNRKYVKFPGDRVIFNYIFEESQQPVVILPHAPHYNDQFFSHMPVNPFANEMYEKADIWMPFFPATPAQKRPELEKQLFYSGYPGFDAEWIGYNKSMNESDSNNEETRVLYIGRKFLDKSTIRPDGYDFVTMNYEDVLNELNIIHGSLVVNNCDYLFVYKPHPSSNLSLVEKILNESDVNNYLIANDASYSFLGYVDLVISPYSTALFVFAISGVPTIILDSDMLREVMGRWDVLGKLYTGMKFYIDIDQINIAVAKALAEELDAIDDVNHLRKYFPDGALAGINDRINYLT